MSFLEGYPLGQEVVAYDHNNNACHKVKVVGTEIGRIAARFPYLIYVVELDNGNVMKFSNTMVFTKEDWDGENLHYKNKVNFEVNASWAHIDPVVAEALIIQALVADE